MEKTVKSIFTFELDEAEQNRLLALISSGNYRPRQTPYSIVSAEADRCIVTLYEKCRHGRRKLTVQGSGSADFVEFVLEPCVLLRAGIGYEKELHPELFSPHAGSDESGKGDYFGPLVVCAVHVDERIIEAIDKLGVKDCKKMTNKAVLEAGAGLRRVLSPSGYHVLKLNPPSYNRLYARMRNINRILAWGHATVIEEILSKNPSCGRVVVDQFAPTRVTVDRALKERGSKAVIEQRHKAEDDMAVAAASVIAREEFIRSAAGFPLGSSDPSVRSYAEEMVRANGPKWLMNNAKVHFTTTDKVLESCGMTRDDLPEEGRVRSAVANGQNNKDIQT